MIIHLVYDKPEASIVRVHVSGFLVEQNSRTGLINEIQGIFAVTEFVSYYLLSSQICKLCFANCAWIIAGSGKTVLMYDNC